MSRSFTTDAGMSRNGRKLRLDHLFDFSGNGRAGGDEVFGHRKIRQHPPGGVFHICPLKVVKEALGLFPAGGGKQGDIGGEVFRFQVPSCL